MKMELQLIGFSKREADIYQALVVHQQLTVTELAQKTGIERRSIYDTLAQLQQAGRVHEQLLNSTKTYSASNPQQIADEIQEAAARLREETTQIPEPDDETHIEVYQGRRALKNLFREIINTSDEHLSIGDLRPFLKRAQTEATWFLNEIEQRGHRERVIHSEEITIRNVQNGSYKTLPEDDIPPTPTIIYADTTLLLVEQHPLTIIKILSERITNNHRVFFNHLWNHDD